MLTRQEIFDKAVGNILDQGRLAHSDQGCYYLSHDGKTRCAIGWLVDEETARGWTSDDGKESSGLAGVAETLGLERVQAAFEANDVPAFEPDINWLISLQEVHDCATSIDGFRAMAKAFAHQNNLKFNF